MKGFYLLNKLGRASARRAGILFTMMIVFGTLTSGCATARLSQGPDTYALEHHTGVKTLGITKVVDKRGSFSAGSIGAAGIKVKGNLVDLTTNYVIKNVHDYLNMNVERVGSDEAQMASLIQEKNLAGVLQVEIPELKMFSADALMQPVETKILLDVILFDKTGKQIYKTRVMGNYEKRIGLTIVDKATGELVEKVVSDAASQLVKDQGLVKALAEL